MRGLALKLLSYYTVSKYSSVEPGRLVGRRIGLVALYQTGSGPAGRQVCRQAKTLLPGLHVKVVRTNFRHRMREMSDYKVEKERFCVKLLFSDGTEEEGNLYLGLHAAHHEGHELVRDVLNQPDLFLPIKFLQGQTRLINKENVLMVSFPSGQEEDDSADLLNSIYQVDVTLDNRVRMEGKLVFLLPAHSSRVKDYLNQADAFVELRKGGEIYLINRKHIISVEEK
jgi:hypothetical protein